MVRSKWSLTLSCGVHVAKVGSGCGVRERVKALTIIAPVNQAPMNIHMSVARAGSGAQVGHMSYQSMLAINC